MEKVSSERKWETETLQWSQEDYEKLHRLKHQAKYRVW